jgi:multidrug resistance efflux pump
MNQETPRTAPPAAEAPASANPSPANNGATTAPSLSVARASSRPPRAQHWSKQRKLLTLGAGALTVLAVLGLALYWTGALFGRPPFNGPTWKVQKQRLRITIVERGSLESANNGDIVCTVKARAQGSTTASTIKWLVDAGAEVKGPKWKQGSEWKRDVIAGHVTTAIGLGGAPLCDGLLPVAVAGAIAKQHSDGEKLMELDSSGLADQLQTQSIEVDKAKSTLVQADEDFHIQELDNATDIEKAENALDLAKIDLEKYLKGDYPQALKDIKGRLVTTKSDVDDWETRAAWSARMVKKGLMSKVQSDTDASRAEGARIAMGKVEEELRVLDYTQRRTIQDLNAKVNEAKRSLEKARSQARSKLEQKRAARQSARSVYEQQVTRKRDIEAEISKCTLTAPQDGMVVYYVPEQVRGGGGSQQSIVAQGEPVREGQKMLQIPDLSQMLVNVRVHEALVAHLHNEDDDKSTGQEAQIRVDAYPNRILKGHVKRVDTVASQQDWFSADVKLYKTLVAIDEQMDGLKPGMSAEVTIIAKATEEPVLVVPIQSVVGTISMGSTRKVFVLGPDGQPQLRDIVVGMSNEQLVEVKPWDESTQTGLKEGERVVQNPTPLLQGSELRPGRTRKSSESEDADHGDGGKKGGKKKGNGKGNGNGFGGPKGPPTPGAAPGAGPGPKAAKGFGGGPPNAQQAQGFIDMMRGKTAAERRDFINRLPEEKRAGARQFLRSQNLEVAE